MGLSREYFMNPTNHPVVEGYFSYMVDIAMMIDPKLDKQTIQEELTKSFKFEKKLAKVTY